MYKLVSTRDYFVCIISLNKCVFTVFLYFVSVCLRHMLIVYGSPVSKVCLVDFHNYSNVYQGKTNSRGVAILLNNNFEYEVLKDKTGNFLNLLLKLSSMTINLITLYVPNNDFPSFFEEIQTLLENESADYNILCGDFNVALNPDLDTCNYRHITTPKLDKLF